MIKERKQVWVYLAAASILLFVGFLGYLNLHNKILDKSIAYNDTSTYTNAESPAIAELEKKKEIIPATRHQPEKLLPPPPQVNEVISIVEDELATEDYFELKDMEPASGNGNQLAVERKEKISAEDNIILDKPLQESSPQKSQYAGSRMAGSKGKKSATTKEAYSYNDREADQAMEIDVVQMDEEEAVEEEIYLIVEEMPSFQGKGQDGFREYIQKNLRYPENAAENGISGKVFVQFAIDSLGELVDAKVVRGVDPSLDEEALRVVKSSPLWTPGKQRGKTVKVQFTFPIIFTLE